MTESIGAYLVRRIRGQGRHGAGNGGRARSGARECANEGGWSPIQVVLDRDDRSPALQRLTGKLAERVRAKS